MFDKYMICEGSLRNVTEGGRVVGFQFDVRITYYRGLRLSMVEGFTITVDGETFEPAQVLFTVRDHAYTLDQMEQEIGERWEFGERATLTIRKPGGLAPGEHTLEVAQRLRISYIPWPGGGRDKKTLSVAA
jgi:hypothetical protein